MAQVHAGEVEKSDFVNFSQAVAENEHAAFIPLNQIVLAYYAGLPPQELKIRYFTPADNTHTSPAGAAVNAQSVIEGLRTLGNCHLADYLLPKSKLPAGN